MTLRVSGLTEEIRVVKEEVENEDGEKEVQERVVAKMVQISPQEEVVVEDYGVTFKNTNFDESIMTRGEKVGSQK